MDVYVGAQKSTAVLKKYTVDSFEAFYNRFISQALKGGKGGYYFTTASKVHMTQAVNDTRDARHVDGYRRNNASHIASWCVCIDGDGSISNPESCIPPTPVHDALIALNINHIIYTTASYRKLRLGGKDASTYKWRLIVPCKLEAPLLAQKHRQYVSELYEILKKSGCEDLLENRESHTLSQMWFLPALERPKHDPYETFTKFDGLDFKLSKKKPQVTAKTLSLTNSPNSPDYQPETDIVETLVTGAPGLHAAMNKFIFGRMKDGMTVEACKAILHGFTLNWDLTDKRLIARKGDIDRLVDYAKKKLITDIDGDASPWQIVKQPGVQVFTKYPDQGGMMEELVDCCMKAMYFPNRPIAVLTARAVISTLGGRVYSLKTGSGIALTALLTGRSGIGKDSIKRTFIWLLDNFESIKSGSVTIPIQHSQEFLGAQYYTSVKNLVEDMREKFSLLSIRTESGHSDKSRAGDMSRVTSYELQLATSSGANGVTQAGAQNEKVPRLNSPSATIIRESVAEIQSEADMQNNTILTGQEGRRSLVIADPIKPMPNEDVLVELPPRIKVLIKKLYSLASDKDRLDPTQPLRKDLWKFIEFKNPMRLTAMRTEWIHEENQAALRNDFYASTFFARLHERLPAYAALLAICEDPDKPVVTDEQMDIAYNSLMSEFVAYGQRQEAGELDDSLTKLYREVRDLFLGDVRNNIMPSIWKRYPGIEIEFANGHIRSSVIRHQLRYQISKLNSYDKEKFNTSFDKRMEAYDVVKLSKSEALELYNTRRAIYARA